MYFPHIDIPSDGPLTATDLDRAIAAGSTNRILHMQPVMPHGIDAQGRYETRRWGQSAYGGDDIAPTPHRSVVPLSWLGRMALAWRRFWLG